MSDISKILALNDTYRYWQSIAGFEQLEKLEITVYTLNLDHFSGTGLKSPLARPIGKPPDIVPWQFLACVKYHFQGLQSYGNKLPYPSTN